MAKPKTVKLRTIKVPITRDDSEKGFTAGIDYANYDVTKETEEDIEAWGAIPELAKKVSQFNARQEKYLETDTSRDYILMKIIIK